MQLIFLGPCYLNQPYRQLIPVMGTLKRVLYVSRLSADTPDKIARAVRAHWSIENNLHWVLGVTFDEDSNRIRKGK